MSSASAASATGSGSSSSSVPPSSAKRFGDIKWGDVDYDDDSVNVRESGQLTMPSAAASIVTKADAKGIKTVVEYVTNEKGQKLKVTRKIKSVSKPVRVNKHVLSRRKWSKFGDCSGLPPGPETNITYVSFEVINLDLRPKKRGEEEKEEDSLQKLKESASIVVCRNCGETGHWTLKCPKRSEISPFGASKPPEEEKPGSAGGSSSSGDARGSSAGESNKYVPMHLRNVAGSSASGSASGDNKRGVSSLQQRQDESTLRVTNLSEDVSEQDLQDLFRRFGHTSRIYLAKDRVTGLSRGFAFINYQNRQEAQNAIDKLNGHGYDNLILHVEWAKPREEKQEQEQ